jgi:hypothetical protein
LIRRLQTDPAIVNELAAAGVDYFWVFGALIVWPVLKFGFRIPSGNLCVLKWLFWLQVFWLMASLIAAHFYHPGGYRNWLDGFVFPYIVGTISWLTAIAALLATVFSAKKNAC